MANHSTNDLRPSERNFVLAMQKLGFGHFEAMKIRAGELVVDPWPRMVQAVKFGSEEAVVAGTTEEFQLKMQVTQFLDRVRAIDHGEIRHLEIRYGLPFSMQLECSPPMDSK